MKKDYYELQLYVPSLTGYRNIFTYHGMHFNCNREFGSFVFSSLGRFPSLNGKSSARVSVSNSSDR